MRSTLVASPTAFAMMLAMPGVDMSIHTYYKLIVFGGAAILLVYVLDFFPEWGALKRYAVVAGIDPARIIMGSGSGELLHMLALVSMGVVAVLRVLQVFNGHDTGFVPHELLLDGRWTAQD